MVRLTLLLQIKILLVLLIILWLYYYIPSSLFHFFFFTELNLQNKLNKFELYLIYYTLRFKLYPARNYYSKLNICLIKLRILIFIFIIRIILSTLVISRKLRRLIYLFFFVLRDLRNFVFFNQIFYKVSKIISKKFYILYWNHSLYRLFLVNLFFFIYCYSLILFYYTHFYRLIFRKFKPIPFFFDLITNNHDLLIWSLQRTFDWSYYYFTNFFLIFILLFTIRALIKHRFYEYTRYYKEFKMLDRDEDEIDEELDYSLTLSSAYFFVQLRYLYQDLRPYVKMFFSFIYYYLVLEIRFYINFLLKIILAILFSFIKLSNLKEIFSSHIYKLQRKVIYKLHKITRLFYAIYKLFLKLYISICIIKIFFLNLYYSISLKFFFLSLIGKILSLFKVKIILFQTQINFLSGIFEFFFMEHLYNLDWYVVNYLLYAHNFIRILYKIRFILLFLCIDFFLAEILYLFYPEHFYLFIISLIVIFIFLIFISLFIKFLYYLSICKLTKVITFYYTNNSGFLSDLKIKHFIHFIKIFSLELFKRIICILNPVLLWFRHFIVTLFFITFFYGFSIVFSSFLVIPFFQEYYYYWLDQQAGWLVLSDVFPFHDWVVMIAVLLAISFFFTEEEIVHQEMFEDHLHFDDFLKETSRYYEGYFGFLIGMSAKPEDTTPEVFKKVWELHFEELEDTPTMASINEKVQFLYFDLPEFFISFIQTHFYKQKQIRQFAILTNLPDFAYLSGIHIPSTEIIDPKFVKFTEEYEFFQIFLRDTLIVSINNEYLSRKLDKVMLASELINLYSSKYQITTYYKAKSLITLSPFEVDTSVWSFIRIDATLSSMIYLSKHISNIINFNLFFTYRFYKTSRQLFDFYLGDNAIFFPTTILNNYVNSIDFFLEFRFFFKNFVSFINVFLREFRYSLLLYKKTFKKKVWKRDVIPVDRYLIKLLKLLRVKFRIQITNCLYFPLFSYLFRKNLEFITDEFKVSIYRILTLSSFYRLTRKFFSHIRLTYIYRGFNFFRVLFTFFFEFIKVFILGRSTNIFISNVWDNIASLNFPLILYLSKLLSPAITPAVELLLGIIFKYLNIDKINQMPRIFLKFGDITNIEVGLKKWYRRHIAKHPDEVLYNTPFVKSRLGKIIWYFVEIGTRPPAKHDLAEKYPDNLHLNPKRGKYYDLVQLIPYRGIWAYARRKYNWFYPPGNFRVEVASFKIVRDIYIYNKDFMQHTMWNLRRFNMVFKKLESFSNSNNRRRLINVPLPEYRSQSYLRWRYQYRIFLFSKKFYIRHIRLWWRNWCVKSAFTVDLDVFWNMYFSTLKLVNYDGDDPIYKSYKKLWYIKLVRLKKGVIIYPRLPDWEPRIFEDIPDNPELFPFLKKRIRDFRILRLTPPAHAPWLDTFELLVRKRSHSNLENLSRLHTYRMLNVNSTRKKKKSKFFDNFLTFYALIYNVNPENLENGIEWEPSFLMYIKKVFLPEYPFSKSLYGRFERKKFFHIFKLNVKKFKVIANKDKQQKKTKDF